MTEQIIDVTDSPSRMDDVRSLFREYAADMGLNLNFQGFEQELADLPGCYAAPRGCILFYEVKNRPVACIALRPFDDEAGEVKRMFVRPAQRGRGIARKLVTELIRQATAREYTRLLLDTLGSMTPARKLYESFGFTETEPYYHNPLPDVVYYELLTTSYQ